MWEFNKCVSPAVLCTVSWAVRFALHLSGGQLFSCEALWVGDGRGLLRNWSSQGFQRSFIWIWWPGKENQIMLSCWSCGPDVKQTVSLSEPDLSSTELLSSLVATEQLDSELRDPERPDFFPEEPLWEGRLFSCCFIFSCRGKEARSGCSLVCK